MKKIVISEKAKKIIAWIMLVIMGIFSAIGILTCLGGIYSCATKKKAEVKKVYADGEIEATRFEIPIIGRAGTNQNETEIIEAKINIIFTKSLITFEIKNKTNSHNPYIDEWGYTGQQYITSLENIEYGKYNEATDTYTENAGITTIYIEYYSQTASLTNDKRLTETVIPTYMTIKQKDKIYYYVTGYDATGKNTCDIRIEINGAKYAIPINYTLYGSTEQTTELAYNSGYKDGEAGKEAYGQTQYTIGYNKGVEEANNYSFTGLISAVFDVPIQTIFGMLNFEILGVNILTVVTSILSIALLIFVLKMILG